MIVYFSVSRVSKVTEIGPMPGLSARNPCRYYTANICILCGFTDGTGDGSGKELISKSGICVPYTPRVEIFRVNILCS